MSIHFDINKLKEILDAFYELTHITITLFDSNLNPIADSGEQQPYCLAIGEDGGRRQLCKKCDREYAAKALARRDTVVYSCHAGIAEAVSPIFFEDSVIAYLMIGKFRDADRSYSSEEVVCRAADRYGLDKAKMLAAYFDLPVFNKSSIDSAILILKALVNYIANEKFIRLDRNMLALEIDKYIEAHLPEKLSAEHLCKRFYLDHHSLCTLFKSNFNDTPQNYIGKKRIQRAKQILRETGKSVREVASDIGMADYNYFIQFFKKKTGYSPLQYRIAVKQKLVD